MFTINDDLSIYATRGDAVAFSVTSELNGETYMFQPGDVVRIKVFGKKDAENVVLQKDFPIFNETESVEIFLSKEDTKIGDVISKPKDYWYEVELNPFTNPQTIIGYGEDGARVFKLFPEGNDVPPHKPVEPEDIPIVDDELDLTSTRPVENQAIARAVAALRADVDKCKQGLGCEDVQYTFAGVAVVDPSNRRNAQITVATPYHLAGCDIEGVQVSEVGGRMPISVEVQSKESHCFVIEAIFESEITERDVYQCSGAYYLTIK